jgi:hypothetical protein
VTSEDDGDRRNWPGRLAALALGFALAGLLAETSLRIAGISHPSFYTTDPCCGLVLRPGASGWHTSEGRAYVEVNADGLRDDPHDRAREPGLYRIAVIGDSYTLAWQIALEDTYFRVAARALGECEHVPAERGVETINFGMAGYGTAQELRTYEMRARPYSPDLVVLAFLSGNDVSENHPDLDANSMRPYYVFRDGGLELDDSFLERAAYRGRQSLRWRVGVAASEYSRVVQLFNEFRNRSVDALRTRAEAERRGALGEDGEIGLANAVYLERPPPIWQEAWQITEALIERLRDTVRADGAALFVVTLSNGIQVHPSAAHRARYAEAMGVPDLGYPERRMSAHLRHLGIPHLVLAPLLARETERSGQCLHGFENAEPCKGHWNELGHRVAGEHLARSLCEHFARGALGARRAGRRSASRPPGPRRGRTLCDSS